MPKTTHANCAGSFDRCKRCRVDSMRARRKRYVERTNAEVERDRLELRPDGRKRCGRCAMTKDLTEFYRHKYTRDGLTDRCMQCAREAHTVSKYASTRALLKHWAANGMSPHECTYCGVVVDFEGANPGAPTMNIDHIVARSIGGSNEVENLAPSCPTCNKGKRARSLADFLTVPAKR